MTLHEIRQQFVKATGRYDLVNADGSDNGADVFIKQANRLLYQKLSMLRVKLDWSLDIPAGVKAVKLPEIVKIDNLYLSDDSSYEELIYQNKRRFFTNYQKTATVLYYDGLSPYTADNFEENGTPTYYTIISTNEIDGVSNDYEQSLAIYFNCPVDSAYTLRAHGVFVESLVEESDTNFLATIEPMLLIFKAAWFMEIFFRNTEGARDWNNAVGEILSIYEDTSIGLEIKDITQMQEGY